jgi:hypothetical protein
MKIAVSGAGVDIVVKVIGVGAKVGNNVAGINGVGSILGVCEAGTVSLGFDRGRLS